MGKKLNYNKMIKNSLLISFILTISLVTEVRSQKEDMFLSKMTAINPVSYTDVIYIGKKDTVLISTYSGRISKIINGIKGEKVIAQIKDEIYFISYNPQKKHIAASTLENGIIIVNETNGKIIKKLPLILTWSLRIDYSDDYKLLFANDQRGNRFIWDVTNDYRPIVLPEIMPNGSILSIKKNIVTLITPKKIIKWDYINQKQIEEIPINAIKVPDLDSSNNFLNINFNVCELYDVTKGEVLFTMKHPSWLRPVESMGGEDVARTKGLTIKDGYFEDLNYQMALTSAKFAKDKIFTSSIDHSIRVWDKKTGQLIESLTGHNASINKIKVSKNEEQLVSVDLKGGIRFWDIK